MATSSGIVKAMAMVLNEAPLLSGARRRAYLAAGLSPELAAAYVASATTTKTAKPKELSEANILTLLNDKLIDVPTAVAFLEQLGYPANEAQVLARLKEGIRPSEPVVSVPVLAEEPKADVQRYDALRRSKEN